MKIIYSILLPLLTAGALHAAPADFTFDRWEKQTPYNWTVNGAYRGAIHRQTDDARNGNALQVTTQADQNFAIMAPLVAMKNGDTFSMKIWVKGSGTFNLGLYCYKQNAVWIGKNLFSATQKITSATDFQEFSWKEDAAIAGLDQLSEVRPVITVTGVSDLTFDDFSFSVTPLITQNSQPETRKAIDNSLQLQLPPVIYAVAGEEMNLYFDNVLLTNNINDYSFRVKCPAGTTLERNWRIIPTEAQVGSHPFALTVYDRDLKPIAQAETTLVISSAQAVAPRPLSVLIVGDSLTDGGTYPHTLLSLMKKSGFSDFKLVGSHAGSGKPIGTDGITLEGYGGWRWHTFCNRWTDDGTYRANTKFMKKTEKGLEFDIQNYFDQYCGGTPPDVITFMLGVNDIAGADAASLNALTAESLRYMELLLKEFRQAAPNALIGVALIPPPAASQDAFGKNYQNSINRTQYRINQHHLAGEVLKKYSESKDISLIPVYTNLDTVYGYPYGQPEPVFQGSSETIRRMNNAVHPSNAGYTQIGQTYYAWLRAQLDQRKQK